MSMLNIEAKMSEIEDLILAQSRGEVERATQIGKSLGMVQREGESAYDFNERVILRLEDDIYDIENILP